MKLAEHK